MKIIIKVVLTEMFSAANGTQTIKELTHLHMTKLHLKELTHKRERGTGVKT